MAENIQKTTIIGAGLAGTALALALYQRGIPSQVYEARAQDAPELLSGVILTPNGLRVLDALGVFARVKDRCWKAEYRTYKNDQFETTRKVHVADEKLYGYKNHRIWRKLLLAEMKLMLEERGISINYSSRFEGIIEESETSVKLDINSRIVETSMVVGTDGIFSTVRSYLTPTIEPEYTGTIGAMAHIRTNTVEWPDSERQFTMQGKSASFITMPEDPAAAEIMVAVQTARPESTRVEWKALDADKDQICEQFFRHNKECWHGTSKQIMAQVYEERQKIFLWPFLKMPMLKRWFSVPHGRVLLIGDAAHAIPPSSGQGANQALEDVYSFALALSRCTENNLTAVLPKWQAMRQERINAVLDWTTNSNNVNRMSEDERNRLIAEGKIRDPKLSGDDMRWLYQFDVGAEMEKLL